MRRLLFVLLIIVLGAVSGWAKKAVVWNNPSLLNSSESYFRVKSVTFSDTATVVELLVVNPRTNIRFVSGTFLRGDDGKQYMIRYCKEFPLDEWMLVEKNPETLLTLVFEPMPAKQKAIDLLEGYGATNFKLFGISDSKKPLKIKPFPYDDKAISDFRNSFFKTDSVCVKGRFESMPDDKGGIIYYSDILANKSYPIAVTVNDDGTFERKFKVDHPVSDNIIFKNLAIPFIVIPGHTIDITIHSDGSMKYADENGNPSPFNRLLESQTISLDTYNYNAFTADLESLDIVEFGQKMERVADDAVRLYDYLAQRYSFSQLEYAVAKASALATTAAWFLEYDLNKRFSEIDSVTMAQLYNPENYKVLRNKIFDDRIALMLGNYSHLQNRYSFMGPMFNIRYRRNGDGTYTGNYEATQDSLVMAMDRQIFGMEELSILAKVHLMNELQSRLDFSRESSFTQNDEDKADIEKVMNEVYRLAKSELTDSFLLEKADRMYQHCLDTKDFTYKLPQTKATQILQKITNQFKGKYVFLDFWSIGCGPCRANIERTESAREELRKNPEVAFVFITNEYESPEKLYNEYVSQHLKNDYVFRLPNEDYVLLRELFQFNGIPHYETLDKQGDVIRIDTRWWSNVDTFNKLLGDIKQKLE